MSYTGPGAAAGAASDTAIEVFFKKFGRSVAGRKIEIIKRDTTGPAPDVARRLAQELIVGEKVDFLAGMDFTPNTMAVAPLSTSAKVPLLIVNSATSGILAKHPYAVRFGFTTTEMAQQLAAYAERSMDVLGQAERIVVPFQSVDGKTLYRARFGPFVEAEARAVCG